MSSHQQAGINAQSIQPMRAAPENLSAKIELVRFADAENGFDGGCRPSYNARDAKAACTQTLACFKQFGAA
jgi:dienelactone hydrolase